MESIVLTKQQKAKSLSAQKQQQKKRPSVNTKLFLGAPTPLVWPEIPEETSLLIKEKLKDIFQYTPPVPIKWSDIKNIPREKRKEYRQTLNKSEKPKCDNIIFGVNAVTRAIENKNVCSVLVANDVKPLMLVKHIIQGCNAFDIPVIAVRTLRTLIKDCLGFPAITVAIKKVPENDPLFSIDQMIKDFWEKSAKIKKKLSKDQSFIEFSSEDENNETTEKINRLEGPIKPINDPYLYRKTTKERCFVPNSSTQRKNEKKSKEVFNKDFISLNDSQENEPDTNFLSLSIEQEGEEETDEVKDITKGRRIKKNIKKNLKRPAQKNNNVYQPLKVKRLKPNPNRPKKGKKK